jgi:hypothetical protein
VAPSGFAEHFVNPSLSEALLQRGYGLSRGLPRPLLN